MTIGWFNKEFIRSGLIEKEYGRILRDAFENRNSGDYDSFVVFDRDSVSILYSEMKDFIEKIEVFIYASME